MTLTWKEAFEQQRQTWQLDEQPVPLAHAVLAYSRARQALYFGLSATDEQIAEFIGDRQEFVLAANEMLIRAARALADQHDDTLRYQLGYAENQVRAVRAWARGTSDEFAAALQQAWADGRRLTRADLEDGAPAVATQPPLLAPGIEPDPQTPS